MMTSNKVVLLLTILSVSITSTTSSNGGCDNIKSYSVNSTSQLSELAESPLNCALIRILPRSFHLTGVVVFNHSSNLSIIGLDLHTNISCELNINSGFRFDNSVHVHLQNLAFNGCSMNDTVQHYDTVIHPYFDVAAVYFYRSSTIQITNCTFRDSQGTGVILYETTGNNVIKLSKFVKNKPKEIIHPNSTYGGLIVFRDTIEAPAIYVIDSCKFERNNNSIEGLGGGLTFRLGALNSQTNVSIMNSSFSRNKAVAGAGLYLNQTRNSTSFITVSDTCFSMNTANKEGGGIYLSNRAPKLSNTLFLYLYDCLFVDNFALWSGGLSSYGVNGRVSIVASNTTWNGNGVVTSGHAIGLKEEHSRPNEHLITARLIDCTISNHNNEGFYNHFERAEDETHGGSATGAIYLYGSHVIFSGDNTIYGNRGSTLFLRNFANATFGPGTMDFSKNSATNGGAIHIESNSSMHLASNTDVYFSFNSAIVQGGAIYSVLGETDSCLFDFLHNQSSIGPRNSNVWFINNVADNYKQEGQSIYMKGHSPPKSCFQDDNSTFLIKPPFRYSVNSTNRVLFDVETVTLNTKPASTNSVLEIMLGESFYLVPTVQDKLHHRTMGMAHLSLKYPDNDPDNNIRFFTYVGPNFIGLDNYTENNALFIKGYNDLNYTLTLEVFFEKEDEGYRDGYAKVDIKLIPCRLGFVYNNITQICECFSNNNLDNMLCLNSSSACVRNGYWFGEIQNNVSSIFLCSVRNCNYSDYMCPTDVCPNSPNYCMLRDKKNLCYYGRGGILCSKCQANHSFTYSAYRCVHNDTCRVQNSVLIMLGVLFYWFVLVFLFFIILTLNLSVGVGLASGIVYYFRVVFLLTDSLVTSDFLRVVISVCVSVTQLSAQLFGFIPVCFAHSLEYNLQHHLFEYASPLFVVITILAIITFSRCCKCPKRISLADNSPNHAICLLILISYTSMTYTSFEILRPIQLSEKAFVYSDPEIPYFETMHWPYALVAIFVEFFISLPICFLLLLAPCLSRWKRVNLVKLRLKPIVDEFQACYKDKHRWFAGFYFLARQLMYIAYCTIPKEVLPQTNSLIHTVCVVVLMVQVIIQPYKKQFWYLNIIDSILLVDLLLLALFPIKASIHSFSDLPDIIEKIQLIVPYFLILLPSLYLLCIFLYLIFNHFHQWCMRYYCKENARHRRTTATGEVEKSSEPKIYRNNDSFFTDCEEREPLLSDISSECASLYSYEKQPPRPKPKQLDRDRNFTTSSLRVSNLKRFPPRHRESAVTN